MNIYRHLIIGVVMLVIVGVFFWFLPQVDLWASRCFFEPRYFILLPREWAIQTRFLLDYLVWATIATAIVGVVTSFWWKRRPKWLTTRACIYVFLSFAIAPGLVANVILKNNWGRPRPAQTIDFGGDKEYQQIWVISDECPTNCSFVCGECAGAFTFVCFVPLCRRKKTVLAAVAIFAALVGTVRLGQGGHFLSDVLSAYLVDYVVIVALYGLIYHSGRSSGVRAI